MCLLTPVWPSLLSDDSCWQEHVMATACVHCCRLENKGRGGLDILVTVLQSYSPTTLPKNMRAESYLAVRVCAWTVNNMSVRWEYLLGMLEFLRDPVHMDAMCAWLEEALLHGSCLPFAFKQSSSCNYSNESFRHSPEMKFRAPRPCSSTTARKVSRASASASSSTSIPRA